MDPSTPLQTVEELQAKLRYIQKCLRRDEAREISVRHQLFKQSAGPEPMASDMVRMYLYYAGWSAPHSLAHVLYGSHYTRKQYMVVQTCLTWMFKRGVALKRGEGNRVQYVLNGEE